MKPVADMAEVAIDFPDKAYIGAFGRDSGFEVRTDAEEVLVKMLRTEEQRREVSINLNYYLLADILAEMARALGEGPAIDDAHRAPLRDGAQALAKVLGRRRGR
ncbi:MAG: hypothetical protein EXQ97_06200 [Alphaproteobacteria bacterium]|nr:hypothetical protein [Alphaproteobacteria bacterium]